MSPPSIPSDYHRLSALMGAHPEAAIIRRFASLNALNLLYLQAELTNLENALEKEAKTDAASGDFEKESYARDWQMLSQSIESKDSTSKQWGIMLKAREKLNEYNQTLYLQHKIAQIGPPDKQNFRFLQAWMKAPCMGNVYLLGADSDTWETFDTAELVCLQPRQTESPLAAMFTNHMLRRYHQLFGHCFRAPGSAEIHKNTVHYSNEGILRLASIFGTVIASVLLVVSIVVLNSVENMKLRFVAIGFFTASFSFGLCLLANGRMTEIFSATAAFAAVQVVFVATTGSASVCQ